MYKLSFKRTSNRYTINDLFLNLERVWETKGSQPTTNDMQCYPSEITFGTYYNHFGSWKKALESFVKHKNKGNLICEPNTPLVASKRKSLNNSLRYDVMKRDNFKCCLCGSSPANDSSVALEIDHIVSLSNGGGHENENLQTLCNKCNSGKKNKP